MSWYNGSQYTTCWDKNLMCPAGERDGFCTVHGFTLENWNRIVEELGIQNLKDCDCNKPRQLPANVRDLLGHNLSQFIFECRDALKDPAIAPDRKNYYTVNLKLYEEMYYNWMQTGKLR